MALIKNVQAEDLMPLEEAQGIKQQLREFALTHKLIVQVGCRSCSTANNLLRPLNWAEPVPQTPMASDLDIDHARALPVPEPTRQITAATGVAAKKAILREVEKPIAD